MTTWAQIRRETRHRERIGRLQKVGRGLVYWAFAGIVSLAFGFVLLVILFAATNRLGWLLDWA